jgi:hypothetical protein
MARTGMDQLVRPQPCNNYNPPVESKIVRIKGGKRGKILISFSSLMQYLDSLPSQKVSPQRQSAKHFEAISKARRQKEVVR